MIFASCGNRNTDTSDDGMIGDETTMDMTPNETESTVDGTNNVTEAPTTDGETESRDNGNEETSDSNDEMDGEVQGEKKTIASDTGVGLNLLIEYTVGEKIDGMRQIDVVVYLESYSLNVTSRGNTNFVRVGDETFYFSTDAISYDGTAKKLTKIAEHTFTTDTENSTLPIYAQWNFNGVYSEKSISAIIIENTIQL